MEATENDSFEGHKQLNEFAAAVGRHHTTINNWFNEMERRRIHYVNRQMGQNKERIFDIDDFKIARFIVNQRDAKWSMDAIYEHIENGEAIGIDPRPFPPDFDGPSSNNQLALMEQLRNKFSDEMRSELAAVVRELKGEMIALMPPAEDPAAERDRYITRQLTELKLNARLEDEAIEAWNKLPDSERMKKKGFFGKEEDAIKRQDFIRSYVNKHKPERLLAEYGMDDPRNK